MLIKKVFFSTLIFSFVSMILNISLFNDLSVDPVFLVGNYLVIIACTSLMFYAFKNYYSYQDHIFKKKIFVLSLYIRIFIVLLMYILFYYITGTEFDVEAKDALFYHNSAINIYKSIYEGSFEISSLLIGYRFYFDDSGYPIFLALLYLVTDGSVLFVRLFQAFLSSYTVILVFNLGQEIWDKRVGKNSAILMMAFQPIVFFAGLHLKETIMIYFTLLFLLYVYRSVNTGFTFQRVSIIVISIVAMLSLRTVLGAVSIVSFIIYIVLNIRLRFVRNTFLLFLVLISVFLLLTYLSVYDEVNAKFAAYLFLDRELGLTGGRNIENIISKGQSFAANISTPFIFLQSIVAPYPSMVKTNISFYNQTLQWYYIGGLFIWNYISFFVYYGLYISIKERFINNSILLIESLLYTFSLIFSMYILSIRYNMIKIPILFFFAGIGLSYLTKKTFSVFIIYSIIITIIIIIWNYVKLGGRGLL